MAQDGIIALGMVAHSQDFNLVRGWSTQSLLVQWESVVIYLIKVGAGIDYFSKYEAVILAMDVLWQCVIYRALPLGGALPIGDRSVFRVVLHSP